MVFLISAFWPWVSDSKGLSEQYVEMQELIQMLWNEGLMSCWTMPKGPRHWRPVSLCWNPACALLCLPRVELSLSSLGTWCSSSVSCSTQPWQDPPILGLCSTSWDILVLSWDMVRRQQCVPKAAQRNLLLLQWFLFFFLAAFKAMSASFDSVLWLISVCQNKISIALTFRGCNCFSVFLSRGCLSIPAPWCLFPAVVLPKGWWGRITKQRVGMMFSTVVAQPELCLRLGKWCWATVRQKWPLWNVFFIKSFKEAF